MFRFGLVFRLWTPVFRFCGWSSGYCLPVCRVAFRYLAPVGYLADLRLPVYGFIFRFTMVCSGCLLSFPDLRLLCKFGNTRHSFAGSPSSIFRFTIFWFPGFSDFMDVGWQGGPACRLTLILAYLCHPCRFYLSSLPTSMSSLASDPVRFPSLAEVGGRGDLSCLAIFRCWHRGLGRCMGHPSAMFCRIGLCGFFPQSCSWMED